MHITDWYRTIVERITDIELPWMGTMCEASPRTEIPNPPRYNTSAPHLPFIGQAVICDLYQKKLREISVPLAGCT